MSNLRALQITILALATALLATGCIGTPPGTTATPTATATATPQATARIEPSPTPTIVPSPTPTPPPPPFRAITATAIVAGRSVPLRATDFDLLNLPPDVSSEQLVLMGATVADLDGDGTDEVFAIIGDGPIADETRAPSTEPAYTVYYGIYTYDAGRNRWAPLRQEVAAWRRHLGYFPKQMWVEYADLTGNGTKEILLYSRYSGTRQALQLEVLSLTGRRLTVLLEVQGQYIYALRGGEVVTLAEVGKESPLKAQDGMTTIVIGEPSHKAGEATWRPSRTHLRYYTWDGHGFPLTREEVREGYPAKPTPSR